MELYMDSSQKGVLFGTSRKGYDKNDVNRYIEEMNVRFADREYELLSKIKELESALREKDGFRASVAAPAENTAANEKLSAENKELSSENCALREKLAELEARLSEHREPAEDDLSSRLGNIIIKANLDADNLIKEAEELAAKQTADAEKNADSIRFDAAVSARVLLESTKKQLSEMTEGYISDFSSITAKTAEECRTLCDELYGKLEACRKASEDILLKAKQ